MLLQTFDPSEREHSKKSVGVSVQSCRRLLLVLLKIFASFLAKMKLTKRSKGADIRSNDYTTHEFS